ncbi:MAG: hypothetical protein EAZ08_09075 [Cytophagales bacterium]|nr:MAG: hypothetical protein EAZ08_09075 [Cytophagales bacterium]
MIKQLEISKLIAITKLILENLVLLSVLLFIRLAFAFYDFLRFYLDFFFNLLNMIFNDNDLV